MDSETILSRFPENLKKALTVNKMTQQTLAKKLGTTQQTVSRWLHGINEPDFQTLLKICVCLDETPNELLGYDEFSLHPLEDKENESKNG